MATKKMPKKSQDDVKRGAKKNARRTKVWTEVTNQPKKTKGGTYLGTATFHWQDDADKEGHSQNIILPNSFKMKVTGKDLTVTPKGEDSYTYSNKEEDDEVEEEKKEDGEEEEKDKDKEEDEEEEPKPKKTKKKAPEPAEDEEEKPVVEEEEEEELDPNDPEVAALQKAQQELDRRKEAIQLRREIAKEEKELAERTKALEEKKRKRSAMQDTVRTKVDEQLSQAPPKEVGSAIGRALRRMASNPNINVNKVKRFILSSLSDVQQKAVSPFIRLGLKKAYKLPSPTATRKNAMKLLTLPRSPFTPVAASAFASSAVFADQETLSLLVRTAALESCTTNDQVAYVSSLPFQVSADVQLLATAFEERVTVLLNRLDVAHADDALNNDAVFAVFCEVTGQKDGVETLDGVFDVDLLRSNLQGVTPLVHDLDNAIDNAAVAQLLAAYSVLAGALQAAVMPLPHPVNLMAVLVQSEGFNGNAFDALALLRSSTQGTVAASTICTWLNLERAGVVRSNA